MNRTQAIRLAQGSVAAVSTFGAIAESVTVVDRLWRGEPAGFQLLLGTVFWLAAVGLCIWIISRRRAPRISVPNGAPSKGVHRFPAWARRTGFAMVVLLVLAPVAAGIFRHLQHLEWERSFVVVIAEFIGIGERRHPVTEELLRTIKASFAQEPDVLVLSLDSEVTEQQGSSRAQRLGKAYEADLVIWGWYSSLGEALQVQPYVENLTGLCPCLIPDTGDFRSMPVFSVDESVVLPLITASEIASFTQSILGFYYSSQGDCEAAVACFDRALELDHWNDQVVGLHHVVYARGVCLESLGRLSSAFEDFTRVLEIEPEYVGARMSRAFAYLQRGEPELVLEDVEVALRVSPSDPGIHVMHCVVLIKLHDLEGASAAAARAVRLDPKDPRTHNARGAVQIAKGKYEDAIRTLDEMSTMAGAESMKATILGNRATAYLRLGQPEAAVRELEALTSLEPDDAEAMALLGSAYAQAGQLARALEVLSQTISTGQADSAAYETRGKCHVLLQEWPAAVSDLSYAIENGQAEPDVYAARGSSLYHIGQFESALDDLTYAIENGHDEAEVYAARATCFFNLKEYESAVGDYSRALDAGDANSSWLTARGIANIMIGRDEDGIQDLANMILGLPSGYEIELTVFTTEGSSRCLRIASFRQSTDDGCSAIWTVVAGDGALHYYRAALRSRIFAQPMPAIVELGQAIEAQPTEPLFYFERAEQYLALGLKSEAILDLEHAIDICQHPELVEAMRARLQPLSTPG